MENTLYIVTESVVFIFVFILRYSAEEIHFNLMAIVSSRKAIHLKDLDRLNQRKTHILNKVCEVYLFPN